MPLPRMLLLLSVLSALLIGGCGQREDAAADALAELTQRKVSIDIDGLKTATQSRSLDGAYLFAAIGFFDSISDADLKAALKHAATSSNYGLAVMLERPGSNVQFSSSELQDSLDLSVRRGSRLLVSALIRHGARPGTDTLFRAAYADDFEMTRMLLQHNNDFSIGRNGEALRMAARVGNLQTLKAFVEIGEAPQEQVNQALLYAALTEQVAVVEYLVTSGVPVNHPDSDGCTALHYLAADAPVESVRYLVEHGAQVNPVCRGKETPLKWAHYGDNQPVIAYLLSVGAEPLP
ncbi:ankyrin repeat domain-containing protein [Halopseudomonas salegens]|uniref:Ankyrin repeat-containing protein n=1 Tax=Halopseudomonas salegens TaxID=1434072 RepID=A0A1H2HL97_9GAMM|nr:ankyrin repeat domain-containing protein [Halopseudomonas salegens]SDU32613.1 Ankyrin repeat-containing protein [Halopseudomonas salegens]